MASCARRLAGRQVDGQAGRQASKQERCLRQTEHRIIFSVSSFVSVANYVFEQPCPVLTASSRGAVPCRVGGSFVSTKLRAALERSRPQVMPATQWNSFRLGTKFPKMFRAARNPNPFRSRKSELCFRSEKFHQRRTIEFFSRSSGLFAELRPHPPR